MCCEMTTFKKNSSNVPHTEFGKVMLVEPLPLHVIYIGTQVLLEKGATIELTKTSLIALEDIQLTITFY